MNGTEQPRANGLVFAAALAAVAVTALHGLGHRPGRRSPVEHEDEGRTISSATGEGRGRTADRPSHIPAKGWKDILWRTWHETLDDRVVSVGAGVAFYGILALFPFLAAFISVYGLVADPATVEQHLGLLAGLLPASALDLVAAEMHRLAAAPSDRLGLGFLVGLGLALWSANAGMKAIFDALNIAYDEEEKRSFFTLTAVTLFFTFGAILFLASTIAVVVAIPLLLSWIGLGAFAEAAIRIGRWPLLLLVVALGIAVLDRYAPSRRKARWRWVTWGSGLSSLLFVVVSLLFSWYAENFGSYDETYGPLGAVAAFMVWLWIVSVVVLVGAELNAEIEHQTARDSTIGPEKPMGRRGARMADTLGAPRD